MYRFLRRLKNGVDYDSLDDGLKGLLDNMKENRMISTSRHKGKKLYKLADNVVMKYRDNDAVLEVFPNRVIGVFFDYDEVFDCKSGGKNIPIVYFLGYEINPSKETVESFNLGGLVKVKVLARGYNGSNEGLLVSLPNSEQDYYNLDGKPCITIGTAGKGKFMDTGKLDFNEEFSSKKFLEGRKGIILNGKVYYNIKEIDVTSTVYDLNYKNGEYCLKKREEKKLFNR